MASVVLVLGPLALVLGSLFWVLSFTKLQSEVTAEIWEEHGVKV